VLEHYLRIQINAKRLALDALDVQRGRVLAEVDNGGDRRSRRLSMFPNASRHGRVTAGCRFRKPST
jgi:hypothetical protein